MNLAIRGTEGQIEHGDAFRFMRESQDLDAS